MFLVSLIVEAVSKEFLAQCILWSVNHPTSLGFFLSLPFATFFSGLFYTQLVQRLTESTELEIQKRHKDLLKLADRLNRDNELIVRREKALDEYVRTTREKLAVFSKQLEERIETSASTILKSALLTFEKLQASKRLCDCLLYRIFFVVKKQPPSWLVDVDQETKFAAVISSARSIKEILEITEQLLQGSVSSSESSKVFYERLLQQLEVRVDSESLVELYEATLIEATETELSERSLQSRAEKVVAEREQLQNSLSLEAELSLEESAVDTALFDSRKERPALETVKATFQQEATKPKRVDPSKLRQLRQRATKEMDEDPEQPSPTASKFQRFSKPIKVLDDELRVPVRGSREPAKKRFEEQIDTRFEKERRLEQQREEEVGARPWERFGNIRSLGKKPPSFEDEDDLDRFRENQEFERRLRQDEDDAFMSEELDADLEEDLEEDNDFFDGLEEDDDDPETDDEFQEEQLLRFRSPSEPEDLLDDPDLPEFLKERVREVQRAQRQQEQLQSNSLSYTPKTGQQSRHNQTHPEADNEFVAFATAADVSDEPDEMFQPAGESDDADMTTEHPPESDVMFETAVDDQFEDAEEQGADDEPWPIAPEISVAQQLEFTAAVEEALKFAHEEPDADIEEAVSTETPDHVSSESMTAHLETDTEADNNTADTAAFLTEALVTTEFPHHPDTEADAELSNIAFEDAIFELRHEDATETWQDDASATDQGDSPPMHHLEELGIPEDLEEEAPAAFDPLLQDLLDDADDEREADGELDGATLEPAGHLQTEMHSEIALASRETVSKVSETLLRRRPAFSIPKPSINTTLGMPAKPKLPAANEQLVKTTTEDSEDRNDEAKSLVRRPPVLARKRMKKEQLATEQQLTAVLLGARRTEMPDGQADASATEET